MNLKFMRRVIWFNKVVVVVVVVVVVSERELTIRPFVIVKTN